MQNGLVGLNFSLSRGYAASAFSQHDRWIVNGGMTTDSKALDTQLMIEEVGFVEMNFNASEFEEMKTFSQYRSS